MTCKMTPICFEILDTSLNILSVLVQILEFYCWCVRRVIELNFDLVDPSVKLLKGGESVTATGTAGAVTLLRWATDITPLIDSRRQDSVALECTSQSYQQSTVVVLPCSQNPQVMQLHLLLDSL